ncbi:CGNR zinc finger domain-containing protein [Plantactinospora sp. GCM10030261]|uniref:CGNR zinc finger domain-containing protein n=1 Tax=Plantactinospora sp. GCM10030261 TaxID=3273420 RepID=UPI0036189E95
MQPLTGGPLALDLVNTLTRDFDALDDPQPWFARQAGRLAAPAHLSTADVDAVRELRAHVRTAVDAVRHGAAPAPATLTALNDLTRAAPAYRIIEPDLRLAVRHHGDPRAILLAQLADAALDLLTDPKARTIRACEGHGCRMLFLPAHPSRRWCSPDLCGNRARVSRHYHRRHKAQPDR